MHTGAVSSSCVRYRVAALWRRSKLRRRTVVTSHPVTASASRSSSRWVHAAMKVSCTTSSASLDPRRIRTAIVRSRAAFRPTIIANARSSTAPGATRAGAAGGAKACCSLTGFRRRTGDSSAPVGADEACCSVVIGIRVHSSNQLREDVSDSWSRRVGGRRSPVRGPGRRNANRPLRERGRGPDVLPRQRTGQRRSGRRRGGCGGDRLRAEEPSCRGDDHTEAGEHCNQTPDDRRELLFLVHPHGRSIRVPTARSRQRLGSGRCCTTVSIRIAYLVMQPQHGPI